MHEEYWDSQGYTGVCTVDFALSGPAASFSNIIGNSVSINPVLGSPIGVNTLALEASYTASLHDPTPPTDK